MDQYLGTQGFLQSRLERLDQIVGQMGDKAHGISQYYRTDTLHRYPSQRGIKGREKLIRYIHTRCRHAIEQC